MRIENRLGGGYRRRVAGRPEGTSSKLAMGCLGGAGSRNRTRDLMITNQPLYQLSYAGMCRLYEPRPTRHFTRRKAALPLDLPGPGGEGTCGDAVAGLGDGEVPSSNAMPWLFSRA